MENNAGYVNDASFSFEGNPESFNVEQEVENTVGGLVYDPYRLSEVLVTIGEKMTGIPLYEYQRGLAFRIIYSILARDGAEITALFSRQSGKSEVIVFCVIVLGILLPVLAKIYPKELGYYSNGIKIGLFAPQGEQVQTVYQRCVARLHSEPVKMFLDDPDILDAPTSSVHFKLKSGTHVTGQSAAKQSKIESKTYNLVFIDECVAENTKVITKRGELPIADVKIGDYVLTQKSGKRVWDEVTNHWSYGEREVYEVTLSDGNKISTTLNHRFYTNFGWLTLNEIIFYRFAGLTINTYLYDEQKLSYEKVNRTTNIRNTVGRRLHRLCGQEVLQKSEVSSESLHQTKGVGGHEVRSSERAYSISSSSKGEQRVWKNELYVLNKVSTNNEKIPQYLLHELREKTRNKRVVINANIGGDSVLVYGRWKSDGVGKSTGYFYPQFFVGRGEATPGNVGKVWFYECDTVNEKWVYLSNALKREEQVLQSNRTLHDSEYVVQDSQFRDLEEMCDLSARVYIQPENIESLLERVQRRSEKEILQLRRVQKISEREEEKEISRGCRVSTKGLRVEQVVSVEAKGAEKIYDISTKETQSFFGNGVLIHNSQDVDTEKVRKSIIPMTASTFGTVVRTGTPGRNKGDFYYVIQNNKKDDKKLTSPKQKLKFQKHFEFNYKDVIRYKREQYKKDGKDFHLLYEKAVLRDKKSSGENSDYFRMSYRIEWLLDVGMFITEERLSEKVYNKKIIFPKTSPTDFVVAGLDIASARANTVLTTALLDTVVQEFGERPIKTLTSWTVLNDLNYEEQFHIIANALLEHNVKVLYSDYTGVGRALTDILMYHLGELIEIIPYTFTPSSKSDMWKALDEDIENERLIVPAHRTVRETSEFKMFDEQMLNLQKYWKGSFMVCEKTQGFKDDFCDSLGMCNLAGNHLYTPSTSVEITSNNLLGTGYRNNLRNNSRW